MLKNGKTVNFLVKKYSSNTSLKLVDNAFFVKIESRITLMATRLFIIQIRSFPSQFSTEVALSCLYFLQYLYQICLKKQDVSESSRKAMCFIQ